MVFDVISTGSIIKLMRIEPFLEKDVVHITKRGARGMNIFVDDADRWRFLNSLYILNDEYKSHNWVKETRKLPLFARPDHWPERKPITRVLAWTLMPNHIHLILQETRKGGVSKFMQRVGGSMTLRFNTKHKNQGSLFQSAYKARRVCDDDYLKYLMFYVLAKNVLEIYPGGLKAAVSEFDNAWNWALSYPFSSLRFGLSSVESPVIDDPENIVKGAIGNNLSPLEVLEMIKEFHRKNH